MEHCIVLQQLSAVAHALNTEYAWGLSPEVLRSYAEATIRYCTTLDKADAASMRLLLSNYHQDHAVVLALHDWQHSGHVLAWQKIQDDIRRILAPLYRTQRLYIPATSIDDLVQDASQDIWRNIDQFRYNSRLSTWLHRVAANCAARSYRSNLAKRRGGGAELDSLEALAALGYAQIATPSDSWADESVLSHDLRTIITVVLSTAPDERLRQIFELSVYEDYTVREIGHQLKLSPARISNLLQQAKQILSTSPAVRAWFQEELAL